MVGLARAFMYAGTPSVVVSLWSVNDEATSLVMTAFYRNLRAGMNKGEALRRAKISMIESGSNADTRRTAGERYSDPFFWAAFVLVGDWGVPASSAD
jgi:CHAT domain-containing protein